MSHFGMKMEINQYFKIHSPDEKHLFTKVRLHFSALTLVVTNSRPPSFETKLKSYKPFPE